MHSLSNWNRSYLSRITWILCKVILYLGVGHSFISIYLSGALTDIFRQSEPETKPDRLKLFAHFGLIISQLLGRIALVNLTRKRKLIRLSKIYETVGLLYQSRKEPVIQRIPTVILAFACVSEIIVGLILMSLLPILNSGEGFGFLLKPGSGPILELFEIFLTPFGIFSDALLRFVILVMANKVYALASNLDKALKNIDYEGTPDTIWRQQEDLRDLCKVARKYFPLWSFKVQSAFLLTYVGTLLSGGELCLTFWDLLPQIMINFAIFWIGTGSNGVVMQLK